MNKLELNNLMICAFRYALGRSTYITEEISSILTQHIGILTESSKEIICREIEYAISTHNYGMEMDKQCWLKVLFVLQQGAIKDEDS